MVLFFSGTGNSAYAARLIAEKLEDEAVSLNLKIKHNDTKMLFSEKPWVICCPVYAWRMPRVVEKWLLAAELCGNREIYFVFTCGDSIGNAGGGAKALCVKKKMLYRGCGGVVMPENYIAMFNAPEKKEALEIVEGAEKRILEIAKRIGEHKLLRVRAFGAADRIKSGVVNDVFYKMFVKTDKFYADDSCVLCGKCVKVCPLNNIKISDGRVNWGKNCTHCMACICTCPEEAIEYGKISKGKPRYVCPKV